LYLNEEQLKTLPLIVNTIGGAVSRSGAQAAAGLLMLLPTIVVFAVMQKRVLNTMMYSGVKG
ncbi:MAG: carbohydrate ABC transporter permease, partial [Clostridia bacterium]|nr:carbohydrate ABC transporter permease [Clostridia bacterium]